MDQGALRHPDGRVEAWTAHALPEGRHVLRVEESDGALWHLSLDHDARPERLQARWREGARGMEATITFFDDEALIWRRGAEPGSEALAVPPGYRLLWPPVAGRDWCLAGVAADGAAALPAVHLQRRPHGAGGLAARAVVLQAIRSGNVVTLAADDDMPGARLTLNDDGRLRAWQEGDILLERAAHDPA